MIRSRAFVILSLLSLVLLGGSAGYRLIEGWSWLESFYMTVITLTTVGFGEIQPLSPAGRLFTIFVIFGGVGLVAFGLSSISEIVLTGELGRVFQNRRKARLNGHTIICGYGRVGRSVAEELHREGHPFVIVDKNPGAGEECLAKGFNFIEGDASNADVLRRAGLQKARSLVSAANSDAINVFIILTVRELREDILIITRLNNQESEAKMRKAGADRIISPYTLAGHRIVSTINRPAVTDFLETVLHSENRELRLEEVDLQAGSPLANVSLGDAHLRKKTGITVLAVDLPGRKVVTHPDADTLLVEGARLIVLGTREQLDGLAALARGK